MSTAYSQPQQATATSALKNGVIGGLAGGLLFGLMMAMMGMLPMVAMLIGSESAAVGFVVHMAISAFFGAIYGLAASRLFSGIGTNLIAGAVYGVIVWVAGALVMMPLMLGMNEMVFQIGQPQWMSLLGHVLFGLVLGGVFGWLSDR